MSTFSINCTRIIKTSGLKSNIPTSGTTLRIGASSGGPVGVASLAVSVGEEQDTIEEVYEPYLIQMGYLSRTPRGRVATRLAMSRFSHPGISGHGPLFDAAEGHDG